MGSGMADIKLPPLPNFREWPYPHDELRAHNIKIARVVLEAAAKVLTDHQIPVGNSAAGELACEWTYDALKECRDEILALEIKHD